MWEAWKQVFNETKQLSEQAFKNVSNQKQIIILFDISKIVSYTTWKHQSLHIYTQELIQMYQQAQTICLSHHSVYIPRLAMFAFLSTQTISKISFLTRFQLLHKLSTSSDPGNRMLIIKLVNLRVYHAQNHTFKFSKSISIKVSKNKKEKPIWKTT